MQIPDYPEMRRRAGVARAEEMTRLATLLRRFFRRAVRSFQNSAHSVPGRTAHALMPVRVQARRWPAPYDISRDDVY